MRISVIAAIAQIVRQDGLVDNDFRSILRHFATFMIEDSRTISASLEIMFIAKAIERMGDQSQNMTECIAHRSRANARHISAEEIEREIQGD